MLVSPGGRVYVHAPGATLAHSGPGAPRTSVAGPGSVQAGAPGPSPSHSAGPSSVPLSPGRHGAAAAAGVGAGPVPVPSNTSPRASASVPTLTHQRSGVGAGGGGGGGSSAALRRAGDSPTSAPMMGPPPGTLPLAAATASSPRRAGDSPTSAAYGAGAAPGLTREASQRRQSGGGGPQARLPTSASTTSSGLTGLVVSRGGTVSSGSVETTPEMESSLSVGPLPDCSPPLVTGGAQPRTSVSSTGSVTGTRAGRLPGLPARASVSAGSTDGAGGGGGRGGKSLPSAVETRAGAPVS